MPTVYLDLKGIYYDLNNLKGVYYDLNNSKWVYFDLNLIVAAVYKDPNVLLWREVYLDLTVVY